MRRPRSFPFSLLLWTLPLTACQGDTIDADGDGYASDVDCDDADPDTYPGAAPEDSDDACMTDADGDGWGSDDPAAGVEAGTDCDDTEDTTYPGAPEDSETDAIDQNCDGPGE